MPSEKYETYLFSYHHKGSEWTIEIKAASPEDAQERMNKMPLARYDGVLVMSIPAYMPGAGLFIRAWCWWKNFWN